MNSTEPGCGGRRALAPLLVLVALLALLAIAPATAGASGAGHPTVAGASSDGYVTAGETPAASDVDGPAHVAASDGPIAAGNGPVAADASPAAADDSPFVRAYGEATEPDLPTSVTVHSVAEGDGPIVEAGGELDLAADDVALDNLDRSVDRRPAGSIREAAMDAEPANALGTAPVDAEGSLRPADAVEDPSTGPRDRQPVLGIGTLVEGMTVPLAPLAGNAAEFALGSLFGGLVVGVVALRRRGSVSTAGPDGAVEAPAPDGTADSPAPDGTADSPAPDGAAESPTLDGPAESSDPEPPAGSPDPDRSDESGRPDPAEEAGATTAGDSLGATATPPDTGDEGTEAGPPRFEAEPGLIPDDRLVERLLARHEGRLKQSAIVDRTGWSKSKVSRLLTRMADDGRVVKVQVGRENVIYLDGAEPRVVSDSSDG